MVVLHRVVTKDKLFGLDDLVTFLMLTGDGNKLLLIEMIPWINLKKNTMSKYSCQ